MAEREGTGGRVPVGIDPARDVPRTSGLDTRIGRWLGQPRWTSQGARAHCGADRGLGADAYRGFGRPPMRDAALRSTAPTGRMQRQQGGEPQCKEQGLRESRSPSARNRDDHYGGRRTLRTAAPNQPRGQIRFT